MKESFIPNEFDQHSKIKDIYIHLPHFSFTHGKSRRSSHQSEDAGTTSFIGRDQLTKRLVSFLNSDSKSGAYLVTGFRGVGKTSLVEHAIKKAKFNEEKSQDGEQKTHQVVRIGLAQEKLEYRDVLRAMIKKLYWAYQKDTQIEKLESNLRVARYLFAAFTTLLLILSIPAIQSFDPSKEVNWMLAMSILAMGIASIITALTWRLHKVITCTREKAKVFPKLRFALQMKQLETRLEAELNLQQSPKPTIGPPGSQFSIGSMFQRNLNYSKATDKELEYELLNLLESLVKNNHDTNLLIVFDELDKIEARASMGITDKEEEEPTGYGEGEGGLYATQAVRKRQEAVARILANLKHFVNEAPAKFIFIAGREMFDASLADIAARDSFYGSIFHDVLYVPSFLKDNKSNPKYGGVTRLIEHFVCSKLKGSVANNENGENIRLREFYDDAIADLNLDETGLTDSDIHPELVKVRMLLYTLQNYVLFLTYRSNGIPKKLISLFEDQVVVKPAPPSESEDAKTAPWDEKNLVFKPKPKGREPLSSTEFYLFFPANFQYELSFITNLYRPYLITYGRGMKFTGDKFLVSSSFLFDHLLKFHNQGFSWRNLELTPEILAVNKAPELRQYVQQILQFFERRHLRHIENGIHKYRYYSRIANEIRFLSKISEPSAAAFNFTLDESVLIKKHYKKKLLQLNRGYSLNAAPTNGSNNYNHSIGFLNQLLGDLHFFDKEYDDAIINYNDSIHPLCNTFLEFDGINNTNPTLFQITNYVRTKLKLAMTYEAMNSYDSAFSLYKSLVMEIISMVSPMKKNNRKTTKIRLELAEAKQIRVLIQPLLASFTVIEKSGTPVLSRTQLLENQKLFVDVLPQNNPSNRTRIIQTNYYKSRGTILFYKNGDVHRLHINLAKHQKKRFKYHKKLKNTISRWTKSSAQKPKLALKEYRPPISAAYDYLRALHESHDILRDIMRKSSSKKGKSKRGKNPYKKNDTLSPIFDRICRLLEQGSTGIAHTGIGENLMLSLADLVTKLGDTALDFISNGTELTLQTFTSLYPNDTSSETFQSEWPLFNFRGAPKTEHALAMYQLSARLYRTIGNMSGASFQMRKILSVLATTKIESKPEIIKGIHTHVFSKAMKYSIAAHEFTMRSQVLKYEYIMGLHPFKTNLGDAANIYNQVSTSSEVKELQILFSTILLKNSSPNTEQLKFELYQNNAFSSFSSMYVRHLELRHKVLINRKLLAALQQKILKTNCISWQARLLNEFTYDLDKSSIASLQNLPKNWFPENVTSLDDKLIFLVTDSIYSLVETIKMLQIHGVSFIINNSLSADAHFQLGHWCKLYSGVNLIKDASDKEDWSADDKHEAHELFIKTKTRLTDLLGGGNRHRLDHKHHWEKALEYYHTCINSHHEGQAYRRMVGDMYYLNDDFSDNFTHFAVAIERLQINQGKVRNRIALLSEWLQQSFDLENESQGSRLQRYKYFANRESLTLGARGSEA